ncbi:MAG: penicillin-binding transpeptidase domain-containing protein [Candidatus Zixiibacteriota bacterium]
MTRTRQENIRLGVLFSIVLLFFVVVAIRLGHLQIYLKDRYTELVNRQSSGRISIPAERGMIYDRYGQLVAKNVIGASLYAYPADTAEVARIGSYLDKTFQLAPGESIAKYKIEPKKFRWVKRRLPDDEAKSIETTAPSGLFLRKEFQREYPFGNVGRQILGFTDIDNHGQSGFELTYDSSLTGDSGWADVRRDGLRNTYRVQEAALVKPTAGKSIVLTIDWRLQDIVEAELHHAVDTFHAAMGMAIFMDCNNGDILAMCHYDPTEKDPTRPTKLRVISDQFEPGSVFKTFTAAGLLDADRVDFNRMMDCENGAWRVGGHTLHDDHRHGGLSFRDIIRVSSNIGIAKWAITMDPDDVFNTYKRFGFGKKLKCGLPGEAAGRLVPPPHWSDFMVAAFAMGHGIAVTPLQLATAFSAVANGGELLQPHVILGDVDQDGLVQKKGLTVLNRASGAKGLDSLRAFLRGVVTEGTAKPVNSDVVAIAGKTGTAQLPDPTTGRYYQNRFVGTFAGFFPYESPVIAGAVVLVDPQPIHYGGFTSGPAFRHIAERYAVLNPDLITLPDRMLAAQTGKRADTTLAPNFVGWEISQAQKLAETKGVRIRSTADEGTVVWQYPPPKQTIYASDEIFAVVGNPADSSFRMPDMTGLPLKKVSAFLNYLGLKFNIKGSGIVVSQSIRPGEKVTSASPCVVECQAL